MVTQIRPLRSSTPTAPDRSMGFRTAWINLLADLEETCLLPPTYPAAKTPQPRYVTQGIERSVRRR
ncbi:MAG: hypothetical protein WCI73_15280 [Phycisphaerae bacterium]